jgi:histone-lysine N-methyltransferase SETMAR
MTIPAHTLQPQRKISSRQLTGNNPIIPPPYSPDLAPSDFHVFLHLKTFLGGLRFHNDNEVKEAVNTWFASQSASIYDTGIQKLVPRYDKCLSNGEREINCFFFQ